MNSLLNYFFPKKNRYSNSKYNKDIVVVDFGNSPTLFSEELIESGSIMTQVWRAGINRLLPRVFTPSSVLLLGLAGGSNARLINQRYPNAHITGVDIDPVMVSLGKKHFGLDRVKNLTIVIADAMDFVRDLKSEKYDLVLLDCFIGENFPKKLESPLFLKKLKQHARYVLINHLWWQKHLEPTLAFMRSLQPHFVFVKTHTRTNTIISLV